MYKKMTCFQFHDCLNALVKLVFSDAHKRAYEKRQKRIENAKGAGVEEELRLIDQIQMGSPEYDQLDLYE